MGLGFLFWIAALLRRDARLRWGWVMVPLMCWAAWSFVSAFFSPERDISLHALDNLLTLLLVPMTLSLLDSSRWKLFLRIIAVVSFLSSGIVLFQTIQTGISLQNRPAGIFSHYMTFAGWTMTALLILAGEALRSPKEERSPWLWPLIGFHGAILTLSLTRNAWIGLGTAAILALFLWKPRPVMILPLIAVILAAIAPPVIRNRISSIADLRQHANRDRKAMLRAGLDMIRDHPIVGTGPARVKTVYPSYRYPDAVRPHPSHLHDNPVHIAAERGIPALLAYLGALAVFAFLVAGPLRNPAAPSHRVAASAALAIAGLTTAGLFEYNWGDAEIWILTLFLLAAPAAPGLEKKETP